MASQSHLATASVQRASAEDLDPLFSPEYREENIPEGVTGDSFSTCLGHSEFSASRDFSQTLRLYVFRLEMRFGARLMTFG